MEGQLVDIEYDSGFIEIVKIVEETHENYTVTDLVRTTSGLYRFSKYAYQVPKESVAGFYDTINLEDTGLYNKINDTFYEAVSSSDTDYETESDEESDTDSEVSFYSEY